MRGRLVILGLTAAAVVLPLSFALFTSQAWEDFYISYRHSVHLAEGSGLTYRIGEAVQGYSSPLVTLLLSATHLLAGASQTGSLWIFRILSIAAYALGLHLLLRASLRSGTLTGWLPLWVTGLIYLLDLKSVSFSTNGMETGFHLLFLAGSLYCLAAGVENHGFGLGWLWAGLMWTRPDSCVYIAAIALAAVVFTAARRNTARAIATAAGICTAAYLPWFVFAWWYYGSPIPQSVQAKAANAALLSWGGLTEAAGRLPRVLAYLYAPPYAEYGGFGAWNVIGGLVALAACTYWAFPGGRRFGRQSSLVALCGALYLALIPRVYPWYYPAVVVASIPAIGAIVSDLGARLPRTARTVGLSALCLGGVVGLAAPWAGFVSVSRLMQTVSENGNRRPLGLWLRDHAAPTDRVFLECPGYIGYFSGLKMLDYPGLVSPEVVQARLRLGDDFAQVGMMLAPEWMVLRTEEVALFEARAPGWLRSRYRLERTFDVAKLLRATAPDQPGILYDGTFHVFRRQPAD